MFHGFAGCLWGSGWGWVGVLISVVGYSFISFSVVGSNFRYLSVVGKSQLIIKNACYLCCYLFYSGNSWARVPDTALEMSPRSYKISLMAGNFTINWVLYFKLLPPKLECYLFWLEINTHIDKVNPVQIPFFVFEEPEEAKWNVYWGKFLCACLVI